MFRSTVYSARNTPRIYELRSGGTGSWSPSTTYSGVSEIKSVDSTNTPNYFKLCKEGKFLPLHGFTVSYLRNDFKPNNGASWIKRRKSDNGIANEGRGVISTEYPRLTLPPVDQSIVDQVVLDAASRAAQAEWDVLTFLAELKGTVNTVARIAHRFNATTLDLATQARRFRRNPWKKFQDLWLEARYGIRPLYYDAKSAVQALGSSWEKHDLVKGTASENDTGSDSGFTSTVVDANSTVLVTKTLDWKRTYRGCAYIELESGLGHRFGADPLVTAWEIIPYSFVVDMFISIGNYLQTVAPFLSGRYKGMCASVKTEVTELHVRNTDWHDSTLHYVQGTHIQDLRNTYYLREYNRFPISDGIPLPGLNPSLTIPQLIDIAALFVKGRNDVHARLAGRR